ncbi:MAG: response regulator [Deltaproteobacteria bacterium]|nr:response regulator [Deltaproteobacteria bacterium]
MNILAGKTILLVDDESEVLEALSEILDEYHTDTAATFEAAKACLETKTYDAAVLDIMGVRGLDLLEIATQKRIPTVMLTAHGLSPENLSEAIKLGAKSYIPKAKMSEIDLFLEELFILQEKGIESSRNWFARLSAYFDQRFGRGWKEKDKRFWSEFEQTHQVSQGGELFVPVMPSCSDLKIPWSYTQIVVTSRGNSPVIQGGADDF